MRSGGRRGSWTAGAGGCRAGGRAWTRLHGWLRNSAPATSISPPSTSMSRAIGRPMADGKPFVRSYPWTKSVLQRRGLITRAPKRAAHRKKRARRPLPGMLLFQDGSKHAWLPQGPELDLVVTLDDA